MKLILIELWNLLIKYYKYENSLKEQQYAIGKLNNFSLTL